jgi:hypothetical protein
VGDNGAIYQVAAEQYATAGDFVRVHYGALLRSQWGFNRVDPPSGQHMSCVVKVTRYELDRLRRFPAKDVRKVLERLFERRYRPKGLRARGAAVRASIRRHQEEVQDAAV